MRAIYVALGLATVWIGAKFVKVALTMEHFTVAEFGPQLAWLTYGLLSTLDKFRELVGVSVEFTSAAQSGGIFRAEGDSSQHAYGRAVDIKWPVGVSKRRCVELAKQAGFTGIGVYEWGLHLDTRPPKSPGNIATWGRIYSQEYAKGFIDVSLEQVLTSLEKVA